MAASSGHEVVVKLLLADTNDLPSDGMEDEDGRTPLKEVVLTGLYTVVKLLIHVRQIDRQDFAGTTPL